MAKTNGREIGVEEIVESIGDRIDFLKQVQVAVRYAYTSNFEEEQEYERETASRQAPRRARKTRRASSKVVRGTSKALFLTVLRAAEGPLSVAEVHDRLMAQDWRTNSSDAKNMVGATLRGLVHQGLVRKDGNRWQAVPQQTATA